MRTTRILGALLASTVVVGGGLVTSGGVAEANVGNVQAPVVRASGGLTKQEVTSTLTASARAKATAFDAAELQDLETTSASTGVPVTTLLATQAGAVEFATAVDAIQTASPESFVDAGLAEEQNPRPWIVFTTPPSSALLETLAQLPMDVDVYSGAPASFDELQEAAATLTTALAEQPGVASAGAAVVGMGTEIQATYTLDSASPTGSAPSREVLTAMALVELARTTPDGTLPVAVSVSEAVPEVAPQTLVQGGRELHLASTNARACTGGFTAIRNGVKGIITAKHCPDKLRYLSNVGVLATAVAAKNSSKGQLDLQFHKTKSPNTTNRQFRATGKASKDDRIVREVANPVKGEVACHWGQSSGYSCSTVATTNYCAHYRGLGTFCNLAKTRKDISKNGDSGGPWFYGLTAIGIHSGDSNGSYSMFTRIGAVKNYLGATVYKKS